MEKLVKLRPPATPKDGKRLRFDSRVVQRAAEIAGEVLSLPQPGCMEWEGVQHPVDGTDGSAGAGLGGKAGNLSPHSAGRPLSAAGLTGGKSNLDVRQIAALFCDWIDKAWNGGKKLPLGFMQPLPLRSLRRRLSLWAVSAPPQGVTGKSMVTLDTRQVVLEAPDHPGFKPSPPAGQRPGRWPRTALFGP